MSHGPPEVPIHLVPPLGGLLSTRGGHGKGLQPCFTKRSPSGAERSRRSRRSRAEPSGAERSRAERGTPSLNGLSAELNLEPCYF